MINVDSELIDEAKAKGLVLSDVMTEALIERTKPLKKDFSEENLKLFCSNCSKEIERGYRCEITKKAYCEKCNSTMKMLKCTYIPKDHIHGRFGEWDDGI